MSNSRAISLQCYHCGNDVFNSTIGIGEKLFCCNGCKMVYEILQDHQLCNYYELNEQPGVIQNKSRRSDKYNFLDNTEIKNKLIHFSNQKNSHTTLYLPQIHCSSCLWLLENIHKINPGIISSRVNFTKKEVFIVFNHHETSLRGVVESLEGIGYEPYLSLNELATGSVSKTDRTRWYKIGIAGFCFANIMMMSLAHYFVSNGFIDTKIEIVFQTISLLLSIPVLFYSATEFFKSAWYGLKNRYLNIDLPVALALVITFIRSIYEIINGAGNGYLDSMSGIVFFMLIGRWLQSRTYQTISFDRDYKSFFPIALNVIKDNIVIPTEISNVKVNDLIQVYSNEIIPVDAILSKGNANIDYSFVSGESLPIKVNIGELVYAGGKQLEGLLELVVVKEVSQSYLTNLWNNPIFNKKESIQKSSYDTIGKYFTYAVLVIGLIAGMYWFKMGETKLMWNAITTVLIVACPCALLLSQNYTNGNILRIFGLNKFYLRSPEIIERLSRINHIVLDKTGTITQTKGSNVKYAGKLLNHAIQVDVASLLKQSSHPASQLVSDFLNVPNVSMVKHFKETEGQGIEGWVNEKHIKIGSSNFVGGAYFTERQGTKVVVNIDGEIVGEYTISNKYRFGVSKLIQALKKKYTLSLISGDNNTELANIQEMLGKESDVFFNQSPQQKLDYIKELQNVYHFNVMMIGDGLNDSGALKQSDVGIAVAETNNNFTPSSDGVIDSSKLSMLNTFIQFAIAGKKIIYITFSISAIYNVIGLYFAIQGILSPVVAAILMPCSSITIIALTYGLTEWLSKYYQLNQTSKL
ncbi:MAG: heavy metal translocating P-type ATPase metal-binding domain-containing protein [bacterium]|nr:heavy metal translocating P-type ATPase metal-binding domain-containing protein [bacterium]